LASAIALSPKTAATMAVTAQMMGPTLAERHVNTSGSMHDACRCPGAGSHYNGRER
jgi:hypothetical protein